MKKYLSFVAVAAFAVLAISATPADKAKTFSVTADTIEGCSCPLFCTCYFSKSADEHMCQFNNVYKFRPGSHYGKVDLSNQLLWMSGDLGGEWHLKPGPGMPTNWVVITLDKKSTPDQKKAIEAIANASIFNTTWKKYAVRDDTIEWHDDAKTSHAKLGSGMAEISLNKAIGPNKKTPTVVENLQYWFTNSNEGFALATSTHNFNGDPKFSHKDRNGFNIVWSASGDVKPFPAKAASAKPEAPKAAHAHH
ncbi:MAG: DUF1326 domain-containing protein [Acidobacteriota bacterium]|nr:DUF1326 domain-containing protein [Acidobacteriota bacterium]